MDHHSSLCPIKYTEHKRTIRKVTKPSVIKPKKVSDVRKSSEYNPRTVRICVTDPDATDSSSDEDELFGRKRVKRYISEISIESPSVNDVKTLSSGNGKKRVD